MVLLIIKLFDKFKVAFKEVMAKQRWPLLVTFKYKILSFFVLVVIHTILFQPKLHK